MMVPMDDHMVHRGDGVFETFKCVDGALYNLPAHLERVEQSAAMLDLTVPMPRQDLSDLIVATVRAGGRADCLVRLLVSRGPGSFGVNPYDCPHPQIYLAVTQLPPAFMQVHPEGAAIRISRIPAKDPFFARTKNCNYLLNALMKKEAVDAGVDFVVAFDAAGRMAEVAAETMGMVTADRRLVFPRLDGILAGTTMMRLVTLCERDRRAERVSGVGFEDIDKPAIRMASEFLVVGTTLNVVSVREFDGRPVGAGSPGPVYQHLQALLLADVRTNPEVRLGVFPPAADGV